jgi:hypothetical protein
MFCYGEDRYANSGASGLPRRSGGMLPMAIEAEGESYLEVFDVSKKAQVAKIPLASVRFIPRTGERIFFSSSGPGNWVSYTVITVEYFIGYDPSTATPATPAMGGFGRVTLYVEESK